MDTDQTPVDIADGGELFFEIYDDLSVEDRAIVLVYLASKQWKEDAKQLRRELEEE